MDKFNLTDSGVINALPDRESIEKFEGEALAIASDPQRWLHDAPADLLRAVFALALRRDRLDRDAKIMEAAGGSTTADRLRKAIAESLESTADFVRVAGSRIKEAYEAGEAMPDVLNVLPTDRFGAFLNADAPQGLSALEDRAAAIDSLAERGRVAENWYRAMGATALADDVQRLLLSAGTAKNRLLPELAKARNVRDAEAAAEATRRRNRLREEAEQAEATYRAESERLRRAAEAAAERAGVQVADVIRHPVPGSA